MTAVTFHPSARAELDASADFYEARLNGLGLRFLDAVEETTRRIAELPDAGAPLAGGFRKRLVAGFPFSVIYRAGRNEIYLVAIAHQHRRPGYWRRRRPSGAR
ncbi:MAG: type II toxin-antitoxin system RelE/ParE family toxin [Bryobacteraceae bacterium]|nr:type II toxin-antitoxin system RelE/ParE family toxin [Bryobacteraceae bacterium]